MQILVLVATSRMRIAMTEVDEGSEQTVFGLGLVGPKRILWELRLSLVDVPRKGIRLKFLNYIQCKWRH